jgi:hypothetical protein
VRYGDECRLHHLRTMSETGFRRTRRSRRGYAQGPGASIQCEGIRCGRDSAPECVIYDEFPPWEYPSYRRYTRRSQLGDRHGSVGPIVVAPTEHGRRHERTAAKQAAGDVTTQLIRTPTESAPRRTSKEMGGRSGKTQGDGYGWFDVVHGPRSPTRTRNNWSVEALARHAPIAEGVSECEHRSVSRCHPVPFAIRRRKYGRGRIDTTD